MRRPPDVPTLRAAVWALRALRRTSRAAMMRRTDLICLERALVQQAWGIAQGDPREVVIEVNGTGDRFAAHAWLEGEPDGDRGVYRKLMRVSAP